MSPDAGRGLWPAAGTDAGRCRSGFRTTLPGARKSVYPEPRPRNSTVEAACPSFGSKLNGALRSFASAYWVDGERGRGTSACRCLSRQAAEARTQPKTKEDRNYRECHYCPERRRPRHNPKLFACHTRFPPRTFRIPPETNVMKNSSEQVARCGNARQSRLIRVASANVRETS